MAAQADQVLAELLTQHDAPEEKILVQNQRTADRKRRKEKLERLKNREQKREKKMLSDLDHVKPDFSTAEYEKRLLRIATKGVVTLFNAVAKQQKQLEATVDSEAVETQAKKAKVESSVKNNFLQLLKDPKAADKAATTKSSAKTAAASSSSSSKKGGSSWSVLDDDFAMKASKMKDWDKASDSDEAGDDSLVDFSDDE